MALYAYYVCLMCAATALMRNTYTKSNFHRLPIFDKANAITSHAFD